MFDPLREEREEIAIEGMTELLEDLVEFHPRLESLILQLHYTSVPVPLEATYLLKLPSLKRVNFGFNISRSDRKSFSQILLDHGVLKEAHCRCFEGDDFGNTGLCDILSRIN